MPRTAGFTLVELMIVVLLVGVVLAPVLLMYQSGSRYSIRGMTKADVTLEARRILKQIHDDFKHAVVFTEIPAAAQQPIMKASFFEQIRQPGPTPESFSLYRFPLHGSVEEAIDLAPGAPEQGALRKPVKIVYSWTRPAGSIFYELSRTEGDGLPHLLSRRVNFFDVKPNPRGVRNATWKIDLQLAEKVASAPQDLNVRQLVQQAGAGVGDTARRLLERTGAVQITDFFDVVSSDFLVAYYRSDFRKNWNTKLARPDFGN